MKKSISVVLYLVVCTILIFYAPKIISILVGSSKDDASTRAEDAHMAENAYNFLREVASVQLGHVLVTYRVDEVSGRRLARYSNEACLNLQADPEVVKEQMEDLQKELHKHILLLGPVADTDRSGFVTEEEGARFRDLFAFGNLVAHCRENGNAELEELVRTTGQEAEEVARNFQDYRELVKGCPVDVGGFFPAVGD